MSTRPKSRASRKRGPPHPSRMGPGQRGRRGAASKESRGRLPSVGVLAITDIDSDGEMQGHPVGWPDDMPPPTIRVVAERGAPALGVGERAVVRYARLEGGAYEAHIIRAVAAAPDRVLGIFRLGPEGGRIEPTDRKART